MRNKKTKEAIRKNDREKKMAKAKGLGTNAPLAKYM